MTTKVRLIRASACLAMWFGLVLSAERIAAQGCEPIRFTTPVDLGGAGQAYQPAQEWRLTLAYRRLRSDEFFVGTTSAPTAGPGREAPVIDVSTFVADVAYSIDSRYRLRLSVPFSAGTLSRKWPDLSKHAQNANGLGDVSVISEAWLLNPGSHENGNFALGFGVKAPTGKHNIESKFYKADGPVPFPADQTIEPGDGGWALHFQAQAFRRVTERTVLYGTGAYMASLKAESDVLSAPSGGYPWSVPDVFSAQLGVAFLAWPDQGLSLSLGARADGIPLHNVFSGGDATTIKRVANVLLAEPGLSLNRGKGTFALSVPIRLRANRMQSLLERRLNEFNGGGFAKYLVFASYSYRF
ncbi:MAG TPA: hypothetical protein VHE78_07685 [Gemmatimonadaceae bacterium]|nr:hypothetical protein [Gemmatimonadaceae bacterium]